MDGIDYSVVGVLADWKLRSRYYDLTNGAFTDPDEFFMPFTTAIDLKQRATGNNQCWKAPGDGWDAYLQSDCVWIQMWVELDSPARLAEYHSFLDDYVNEQKRLGRFPRPLNNRLLDVTQWMQNQRVVSSDVEVQTGLAFAFLFVCLVNTVGLLLAKFTRKSGEIGLRRALGATRVQIRTQFLTEAILLALIGGATGIGAGALATAIYAHTKHWTTVIPALAWGGGVGAAILIGAIAGIVPAIRAARLSPTDALRTA